MVRLANRAGAFIWTYMCKMRVVNAERTCGSLKFRFRFRFRFRFLFPATPAVLGREQKMLSPLYQRLALFTATPAVDYRTKGKGRNVHYWTNLKNKGLISADRRTSLLSRVQYPVP